MPVLFQTGFRPFFLSAGLWAMIAMSMWSWSLAGGGSIASPLGPVAWHGHELMWGFTGAVLAGFFLTAARAWTGLATAQGLGLVALTLLWVADRVGGWTGDAWVSVVGASFLMAVGLAVGRPIVASGSRRNIGFVPLLATMSLLDLAGHLGWMSWTDAARVGLDAVLVILAIVGGRIIPLFTRNAVKEATIRQLPALEWASLASVWALLAADLWSPWSPTTAYLAAAAGALHALRWSGWAAWSTRRSPLLWVLHVGYAWLWVGLLLRGCVLWGVPPSAALHALTAGAIGTLTLGMMARVALGHTGRPLEASSAMAVGFVVVNVAAMLRVGAALGGAMDLLWVAGALFAMAAGIYVLIFAPVLFLPRVDSKPG